MNGYTSTTQTTAAGATTVPTVGNSGHFDPNQAIHAPASETLEVAQLGNHWAQLGMRGHLRGFALTSDAVVTEFPAPEQHSVGLKRPLRARMWKFSIPLRHPETGHSLVDLDNLRSGLNRKSINRYMWLVHDRDQGSAPHLQGALKLSNSRTREQLASSLGLLASTLKPLIDRSGQHGAFERYCRYLLHEGPEARADGKFQYSDEDAHSNFDFREMIDRYFGYASAAPSVSADQIKLMVYRGDMTPSEVEAKYPRVFIRNLNQIESLHKKGEQSRREQAEAIEHAIQQQEADRRLELEAARRQHLTAQGFEKDEIEHAIQGSLSEDALHVLRAEANRRAAEIRQAEESEAVERKAHEERVRTERESTKYEERLQSEADEEERKWIVAAIALESGFRGDAEARDAAALHEASNQGLASKTSVQRNVLSIGDARKLYIETSGLPCRPAEDLAAKVREDVVLIRKSLERAGHDISVAEYHAVDGNVEAFEKALSLRAIYEGYPDLVTLPLPRADLSKKQRTQLLEAA